MSCGEIVERRRRYDMVDLLRQISNWRLFSGEAVSDIAVSSAGTAKRDVSNFQEEQRKQALVGFRLGRIGVLLRRLRAKPAMCLPCEKTEDCHR